MCVIALMAPMRQLVPSSTIQMMECRLVRLDRFFSFSGSWILRLLNLTDNTYDLLYDLMVF
jgi:hypothetical protein